MKKQIISATLALGAILFGMNNVQAQNGKKGAAATEQISAEATATVNIELADVISLDLSGENDIYFKYLDAAAYNADQTAEQTSTLTVTSTQGFNISVLAAGQFFNGGNNDLPVNVVQVIPARGTIEGGELNTRALSYADENSIGSSNNNLVEGATKGSEATTTLSYKIPKDKAQTVLLGKKQAEYTTTVTYTATTN